MALQGRMPVEVHEGGCEVVNRLAEEWRELCDQSSCGEPFCRPEWVAAYLRAFEPEARVLVLVARLSGSVKAILPLLCKTGFMQLPLNRLSTACKRTLTRFDLVRADGPEGEAAMLALWDRLKSLESWHVLQFWNVLEGSPLQQLVRLAQVERHPVGTLEMPSRPYVPIMQSGPDSTVGVQPQSKRLGRDIRHILRVLGSPPGRLRLKRFDRFDSDAFQRYCAMEASGWKGKEHSAITSRPEDRQFWDQIGQAADKFGYFTLYELQLDDQVIAGHLGATYRGRYLSPRLAYDERFEKYSPGNLILHFILQDCAERGILRYDFAGLPEEWKMRWTSSCYRYRSYFVMRKTFAGFFLHTWQFKGKPTLKKLLRRKTAGETSSNTN